MVTPSSGKHPLRSKGREIKRYFWEEIKTTLSAMRNLNGYEIGGRNLRVDNVCTEKARMEMQNLLTQPPIENPYGKPIQAEEAEAISKVSLSHEQMFELIKQMKLYIQNNPTEARNVIAKSTTC